MPIDLYGIPGLAELFHKFEEGSAQAGIDAGLSRHFKLKRNQHMILRYPTIGRTRFCYTPHPDTNGDYWYFNEVRVYRNPRAKEGELVERWERTKYVRCARRRTAKKGAMRRYEAAMRSR